MSKQLIISLISDQTIPNIQIIKEFGNRETDYLFILTKEMEKKGISNWIKDACKIELLTPIIVNEYSLSNIQEELSNFDYLAYTRIFVNITGGTKIMSLGVYNFFKSKNADIYYITKPQEKNFLHIGENKLNSIEFTSKISLKEYLTAYGFETNETEQSGIDNNQTQILFQKYCSGIFDKHLSALKLLREKRNKKISKIDNFQELQTFLKEIEYKPKEENKLSNAEIRYLSGEWFEEYIGEEIKRAFSLHKDDILIGATINKDISGVKELNPISALLGIEVNKESPNNEIDVMFLKDNRFHIIECKTSIIDSRKIEDKVKEVNILGETIYKSDALKTKFGLHASSYIFTLTDFKEYISENNNKLNNMINLINRASIAKIKLVDRSMLLEKELNEIIA